MAMNALEKATAYLNLKPHTAKEVTDYLLRKGYQPGDAEDAVRQLSEYGFIDDLNYAKMYFEYGFEKGRGRDRIVRELAGKGVNPGVIDRAWDELEDIPDEREVAFALALRIAAESGAVIEEMSYEEKQKLRAKIVRRLTSRGFSGGVCYSAARETVK
ncbi:MAG: regulatory protein RecX [Bacillota bacterium]